MARRSIIGMLAIAIAAAAMVPAAAAQPGAVGERADTLSLGQRPLRKSITQLSASEIRSLRRGFARMRAWNNAPRNSPEFRRSLVFWANMHAHFGENCAFPGPPGGLSEAGMAGVVSWSATGRNEESTWCQCEHGSYQFLLWHRMYLFYFERVLQAAAQDPHLRLPYWDYNTDGHLPPAYRARFYLAPSLISVRGVRANNPLYAAGRSAGLNDGSQALDPQIVLTDDAMQWTRYSGDFFAGGFNSAIEGSVHGNVHCAVAVQSCPTGLMGAVPSAALDPIFYSHHANIDRFYECWLQVNLAGRLPSLQSELDREFSFVDGDGSVVRRRVRDMMTTAQLDYGYTRGGGCPPVALRSPFPDGLPDRPVRTYLLRGETPFDRGVTTIALRIAPDLRTTLREAAAGGRAPARALLVIDGLAFNRFPRVLYKVFIRPGDGRRIPIGVINFFNRTAPHAGHGGGNDAAARVTFDVSAALARLGTGEAALLFEPATGLTGSTPALAARQIDAGANLRFRSVTIEIVRPSAR